MYHMNYYYMSSLLAQTFFVTYGSVEKSTTYIHVSPHVSLLSQSKLKRFNAELMNKTLISVLYVPE